MKLFIKIIICAAFFFQSSAVIAQQRGIPRFQKISAPTISITKSYEKNFVGRVEEAKSIPRWDINASSSRLIPDDVYVRNFGFFCREELQLQKRTGVNFSLRLGSLAYCNFIEGKSRIIGGF